MPDQNTSAREWKPGDFIVIASHSGHVGETGVVAEAHGSYVNAVIPAMGGGQSMSFSANTVRPLVAIDPESPEQVERLGNAIRAAIEKQGGHLYDADLAAALRSLVAEPEPEEPTGLGAVVDAGGKCAVRNRGRGRGEVDWVVDGFWSTWASLPRPLTVLSPGYLGEEA
jgi:hypothetical protein